jgi:hypothetical protein
MRYQIVPLKGDHAGREREAALSHGIRRRDLLSIQEALAFAYYGRLQEANRTSLRAMDLVLLIGSRVVNPRLSFSPRDVS